MEGLQNRGKMLLGAFGEVYLCAGGAVLRCFGYSNRLEYFVEQLLVV